MTSTLASASIKPQLVETGVRARVQESESHLFLAGLHCINSFGGGFVLRGYNTGFLSLTHMKKTTFLCRLCSASARGLQGLYFGSLSLLTQSPTDIYGPGQVAASHNCLHDWYLQFLPVFLSERTLHRISILTLHFALTIYVSILNLKKSSVTQMGIGKYIIFSLSTCDTTEQLYEEKFNLPFSLQALASIQGSISIQMNNWLVSVLSCQIQPWSKTN